MVKKVTIKKKSALALKRLAKQKETESKLKSLQKKRVVVPEGILFRPAGANVEIINPRTPTKIFELKGTQAMVWLRLQKKEEIRKIAEIVAKDHEVQMIEAVNFVKAIIKEFIGHELLKNE